MREKTVREIRDMLLALHGRRLEPEVVSGMVDDLYLSLGRLRAKLVEALEWRGEIRGIQDSPGLRWSIRERIRKLVFLVDGLMLKLAEKMLGKELGWRSLAMVFDADELLRIWEEDVVLRKDQDGAFTVKFGSLVHAMALASISGDDFIIADGHHINQEV
ncbi:hypothetical protein [Chloroflexus sp.]|uniref:hypothetical protein n=1 Tax=Chloroflexus sp. TaxID=1904827 RepID=UPI002ACDABE6|nr:hypothetical protein [Chloroflexus sp.]